MILRNMIFMTGLNVAKAAASLIISIMIAGVVAPAEFGLVAFAIPLMALLMLLTDLGLSSAIVRHPELDQREAGAVIGLLGLAGLASGVIMAASALWIESVAAMHGLARVLWGFALVTALSIWATAPRALIERTLAYGRIVKIEAGALISALAIFTMLLQAGSGIMALVAFHLVLQGIRAICFTFSGRMLFKTNFAFKRVSVLARIGGWVFVTNLLSYLARNLDRMLIGGVLGATALGIYGLASQVMTIPLILVSWPVSGVLLSTLSRMRNDSIAKARVICAVFTGTAAVTLPMMAYFMFGLEFPISAIYQSRWSGLASIIALLAPAGAMSALGSYQGAVLIEKGAVRLNFVLSVFGGVTLTTVYFLTVSHGLEVLVPIYTIAAVMVSLVSIFFICREASISASTLMHCLLPGATAALLGTMLVAVTVGLHAISRHDWICALAIYLASVMVVFLLQRRSLIAALRTLIEARVSGGAPT